MERAASEKPYLIGQLARKAGVSARAIRFYERAGILPPPRRSPAGYRLYTDRDVERLRLIQRGRAVGLSLADVAQIIALRDGGRVPCGYVRALVDERLAGVRRQLRELEALERELAALQALAASDGAAGAGRRYCRILEHDAAV